MAQRQITERDAFRINGFMMLLLSIGAVVGAVIAFANASENSLNASGSDIGLSIVTAFGLTLLAIVAAAGLLVLQPNEARVLIFFGRYAGTVRAPGFHWVNPLAKPSSKRISLRMNNFDSAKVKVNDAHGNPVEIAAVVVWRVIDSARASFDVQNYHEFVRVQSETAVRHLATSYPYDSNDPAVLSLSGNVDEVSRALQEELVQRLAASGVEVIEARLSHLAYAAEIAAAMLRRQQAAAVVAARQQMVEGAVGMVQLALRRLEDEHIVELNPDRKAALVSNLLVVLTSEQTASPVLNTGANP